MFTDAVIFRCVICRISWVNVNLTPLGDNCPRCDFHYVDPRCRVYHGGEDDSETVVLTVILAAASTTAIAFLKALAEDAGKDVYAFLKRKLRRGDAVDQKGDDISKQVHSRNSRPPTGIRIIE